MATGAVGISVPLPTPGISIEPYFSPGIRYRNISLPTPIGGTAPSSVCIRGQSELRPRRAATSLTTMRGRRAAGTWGCSALEPRGLPSPARHVRRISDTALDSPGRGSYRCSVSAGRAPWSHTVSSGVARAHETHSVDAGLDACPGLGSFHAGSPATGCGARQPGLASSQRQHCVFHVPSQRLRKTVWDQGARSGGDGATVRTAPRRVNAVSLISPHMPSGRWKSTWLQRRTPHVPAALLPLIVVSEVQPTRPKLRLAPNTYPNWCCARRSGWGG